MKRLSWLLFCIVFFGFNSPSAYLTTINRHTDHINKEIWQYVRARSHGKNASHVERHRQDIKASLQEALDEVKSVPPYRGDKQYQNAVIEYLENGLHLVEGEFGQLIEMEDMVTGNTVEVLEARMRNLRKANERMLESQQKLEDAFQVFASRHDIVVHEYETKTAEKLKIAREVTEYYNEVFLVLFKSQLIDQFLTEAINQSNPEKFQVHSSHLNETIDASIQQLKDLPDYDNDGSLKESGLNMLNFYRQLSRKHLAGIEDYLISKSNYREARVILENTPKDKIPAAVVEQYNESARSLNSLVNDFNQTNVKINKQKSDVYYDWVLATDNFFDSHVPK